MLRVAVPIDGTLAEPTAAVLRAAGYRQRADDRVLSLADEINDVEFYYLQARDIPTFVGSGDLHFGITGSDVMDESTSGVHAVVDLGYGQCEFRIAVPAGSGWTLDDLDGRTIATCYPRLVRSFLTGKRVGARITRLDGLPELAVRLGLADAVAVIVPAGHNLLEHGLEFLPGRIGQSSAVLMCRQDAAGPEPAERELAEQKELFVRRMQGVSFARSHLMIKYWCQSDDLDVLEKISPAVSREDDPDGVLAAPLHVVPSVVPRGSIGTVMDDLLAHGARAVVSSELHAFALPTSRD